MTYGDRYAHIYISPHLDDVVFSCGGRMWQQVRAGDDVAAVSIFAGVPDPGVPFSPYAEDLHARWDQPVDAVKRRQEEDRQALAYLGVSAVHWSYKDCIYRRTPAGHYAYASEEALWGDIHPAEVDLIRELADRLGTLPLTPQAALYIPLAVGRHVDHRIARRAAEAYAVDHHPRDWIYYEDFPYAQEQASVRAALSEGRWKAELVSLSQHGLEAKIAAIAHYRSQISTFWGGRDEMEASVRAFAERAGAGKPAERYWRRVSTGRPG